MLEYHIGLAYERTTDDLHEDEIAEDVALIYGFAPCHSTNLPIFGVEALDIIRTLQWSTSRPVLASADTLCAKFRRVLPTTRGFAIWKFSYDAPVEALYEWKDEEWCRAFPGLYAYLGL
jgi:hypothetical protein